MDSDPEAERREQAERIQDLENLVGMLLVHLGFDRNNVRASSYEEFKRLFDRLQNRPIV